MDKDLEIKAIQELLTKIKNDEYIKVDREIVDVDKFYKISSTSKPEKMVELEENQDLCRRILDKLEEGAYTCVERPDLRKSEDRNDLSSTINQQRYSVSYATVFQPNSLQEHFIVCKSEERAKEVLAQLKLNENTDEEGKSSKKVIKIYKTIQEAVENASPGQTVIIDDGIYHETILLDKSIEIKALNVTDKKEDKKVEIVAESGDCITLKASCGRLEGIKITCDTPGFTFCTKTITGILEIENCVLFSSSAGCIHVDEKARLTIKDSELCSTHSTASLMKNTRTVIMDCRFTQPQENENKHPAIIVDSGATCILIDCTINSMINFKPFSNGMLLRCHISTQGKFLKGNGNGIYVQEGAEPLIQSCEIDNCAESGIRFDPKSKGVINDCKVHHNTMFGFISFGSERFLVSNSHVYANHDCGMRTVGGARGDIINTLIDANDKNAILIENGCDIKIKSSEISNHINIPTGAIFVKEPQEKTKRITNLAFIDSVCQKNSAGFSISGNSHVVISKSKIQFNRTIGIIVEKDAKVDLDDSEISDNGKYQLACPKPPDNSAQSRAMPAAAVSCNAIINAKSTMFGPYAQNCILLGGKSISTFTQNCDFKNPFNEFIYARKNMLEFEERLIQLKLNRIDEDMKKAGESPELVKQKEQMSQNLQKIGKMLKDIDDKKEIFRPDNISLNRENFVQDAYKYYKVSAAIVLEGDAHCTIEKSDFKNSSSFVEAKDSSFAVINESKFFNDSSTSVKVTNKAKLEVKGSSFSNAETGILLEGTVSATITETSFENSRGNSVQASQDGWHLTMEKCSVLLGRGDMVNMSGKGEAYFRRDTFNGKTGHVNEKAGHKTGGADTALHIIGVPKVEVINSEFIGLQIRGIDGNGASIKVNSSRFIEVNKFPLLFTKCNIEIEKNVIRNKYNRPENAIHLQDGCTGKICQNIYSIMQSRFCQMLGKASSVEIQDNQAYEIS